MSKNNVSEILDLSVKIGKETLEDAISKMRKECESKNIKVTDWELRQILLTLGFNFMGSIIENIHAMNKEPKRNLINIVTSGLLFCFDDELNDFDKHIH